jgi:hypothetical protein
MLSRPLETIDVSVNDLLSYDPSVLSFRSRPNRSFAVVRTVARRFILHWGLSCRNDVIMYILEHGGIRRCVARLGLGLLTHSLFLSRGDVQLLNTYLCRHRRYSIQPFDPSDRDRSILAGFGSACSETNFSFSKELCLVLCRYRCGIGLGAMGGPADKGVENRRDLETRSEELCPDRLPIHGTMKCNHRGGATHGDANAPARMIRKSSYRENRSRVAHLRNFTGGGLTRPFVKRVRSPKRTIF